jgi:hypothetical protein
MEKFMLNNLNNTLTNTLNLVFIFCCLCVPAQISYAAEATDSNAKLNTTPAQRFGTISRIIGKVVIKDKATSGTRYLKQDAIVYVGERISALASGEAVIKTDDGGYIAIRPNTEFIAQTFIAQGKNTDSMAIKLITGSLRVITGWIGKLNPNAHIIYTPTATIGIRGTDHEPFVLPADLAGSTPFKAGTYDKVNRGKTLLNNDGQALEIETGRVGFARKPKFQAKGLMTILMPVLLDKVPDFYIPGKFDAELDLLSKTADADSAQKLAQKPKNEPALYSCDPAGIAKKWLQQFDNAVEKRNAQAILVLFSPEVNVRAIVRNSNGKKTTVEFSRDELVQSTIAAAKGLEKYSQRRLTINAEKSPPDNKTCEQISVKSSVIEQGIQSGKSYRLESDEEYLLILKEGKWLANKAQTTQR